MFCSICYDIVDDRRRQKVAEVLKDYGARVQFSVFEANLLSSELEELKSRLKPLIDLEEDSLRIYPLCSGCVSKVHILGEGSLTQDPDIIIV